MLDLLNILAEAQDRNYRYNLCGVLYFADSCFFQCLQGETEDVMNIFDKIKKDRRHENVTVISTQEIQKKNFQDWFMKYVGKQSHIKQFFIEQGIHEFNPAKLDQSSFHHFLNLLQDSKGGFTRTV